MRRIAAILGWIAVAVVAGASVDCAAASAKLGRRHFSGHEYVRLDAWGRAKEYTLRWSDHRKNLQMSRHGTQLSFKMNSREAAINGITVWLAFPVEYSRGRPYISQTDLEDTLAPVLSPPRESPGYRIRTICLDPGHGGKDPGNRVGSRDEKTYTLLLAKDVRRELVRYGFKVVFTRTRDVYVGLAERARIARRHGADLFVSLHFNSSKVARNEAKGAETYCITPAGATSTNARGKGNTHWVTGNDHQDKSMLLAYEVEKALVTDLHAEDRGVRRARFAVLRDATMPAILVEGGFMSNPEEGHKIFTLAYRRKMGRAIAQAIVAYQHAVQR